MDPCHVFLRPLVATPYHPDPTAAPASVAVLLTALGLECPHDVTMELVRQHSTSAAITLTQFVGVARAALRYKR